MGRRPQLPLGNKSEGVDKKLSSKRGVRHGLQAECNAVGASSERNQDLFGAEKSSSAPSDRSLRRESKFFLNPSLRGVRRILRGGAGEKRFLDSEGVADS
jgi:hypothetical protein